MTQLLLFFVAGVLQDFLVTLNWRYVTKEKVFLASLFSFFSTVVAMTVLYTILTELDSSRSILAIVVYSLGIAIGTWLAMKTKWGMEK